MNLPRLHLITGIIIMLCLAACKKQQTEAPLSPYPKSISARANKDLLLLTFEYDAAGQPLKFVDNLKTAAQTFTYNTEGKLVKLIAGTDSTVFTYNTTGDVATMKTFHFYQGKPNGADSYNYTYSNGNVIRSQHNMSSSFGSAHQDYFYTYDKDGLLTVIKEFPYFTPYYFKYVVDSYNDETDINPWLLDKGLVYYPPFISIPMVAKLKRFPKVMRLSDEFDKDFGHVTVNFVVKDKKLMETHGDYNQQGFTRTYDFFFNYN